MKQICILIPVYNEEQTLLLLKDRLLDVCNPLPYHFRFFLVNDGSTDNSLSILKQLRKRDPRFCYLNLSRNFGKEVALLAGMDYFQEDALIIMDADLQDPPELIPKLIREWELGYDDVYAKRISREDESFVKRTTSFLYYRVLQKLSSVPIQKDTGDFRLLDRRCVNALKRLREEGRCSKSLFSWIGYSKKEVPFHREGRAAGTTKWNYRRLFGLAIDGITSLSVLPLRLASLLGGLSIAGAVISFCLGSFLPSAFQESAPFLPLLLGILLLLFGLLFLLIGIVGEYLGRMFAASKQRPLYLVDCYNERKEYNEETTAPSDYRVHDSAVSYRRPS